MTATSPASLRPAAFVAVLVAVNLLLVECAGRVLLVGWLAPTCDAPGACLRALLWPELLRLYYPELAEALEEPPDEETLDVLLLGGSVLNDGFGSVEPALAERFAYETRRPVRVHNLAEIAHTTRDSQIKYEALREQHYDLVVFYHGINESRINNAPPELFHSEYEHYGWYRHVNRAAVDRWAPLFVTPAAVAHLTTELGRKSGLLELVPPHRPEDEWLAYGHEVRSRAPFRRNLEAILARAREKSEPILLMTFATWVPEDYTPQRFAEMQTGYTTHKTPLTIWGEPDAVLNAVRVHNAEIREAARRADVALVDQAVRMPRGRRYFNDVCHLTVEGSSAFVANMFPTALQLVRPKATSDGPGR